MMRFSSTIGTMSAAIDTATMSSIPSRSVVGMPLLVANACMNLNPTPQPDRWGQGYVEPSILGLRMATAGELPVGHMMVADYEVDAALCGIAYLLDGFYAAVEDDDQLYP